MNSNVAMFLSFFVVSLFSFISIAAWAGTRHQERKDYYRSETLKKLAESGSAAVIDYLREEERVEDRRRAEQREREREGHRLVGLILLVVGGAFGIALHQIVLNLPVYLFGLLPMGIGIVFLLSPLWAPRR